MSGRSAARDDGARDRARGDRRRLRDAHVRRLGGRRRPRGAPPIEDDRQERRRARQGDGRRTPTPCCGGCRPRPASARRSQDADFVIEAAPERIDLKLALFADIEQLAPPAAIIATNTSALSITEMAGSLKHPSRVAGMHFFNPVHKMKLIEIVQALESAPATLEAIEAGRAADGEGDRAGPRVARLHHHPRQRQHRQRGVLHADGRASPRRATSTRR